MNPEIIKQLADEITSQTIIQSWPHYLIFGAIALISSAIGSYFGSYIKKKAEQKAISSDFNTIKKQLEETTTLSESIKIDIKNFSERSEKINWLKQEKLEQYVLSALEISDYFISKTYHELFDKEQPKIEDPWRKILMLQVIYLPELSLETNKLGTAASQFQAWIAKGMQERAQGLETTGKLGTPSPAHMNEFTAHIKTMNAAVIDLQNSTYSLAEKFLTVRQ